MIEIVGVMIGGLTLIITTLTLLLMFKKQRVDDLWGDVCHYQNDHHLCDEWVLRAKSLNSVIRFCDIHIGSRMNSDEIKTKMKDFKARAKRLKQWNRFW